MTLKHSSKAKWARKQHSREHRDPAVSGRDRMMWRRSKSLNMAGDHDFSCSLTMTTVHCLSFLVVLSKLSTDSSG